MANEVFLTKEGFSELEKRLEYLKTVARVDVANKIEVARNYGDISENAEYDAAREEEVNVEQEIQEIQNSLRNAQIINSKKVNTTEVEVGNTVKIYDSTFKENLVFKIVGRFEADPVAGLISNESPLGQALLGSQKGDKVEVEMANGTVAKYEVKEITVK